MMSIVRTALLGTALSFGYASLAHAEWTKIQATSDSGTTGFVDPSTVKTVGGYTRAWMILTHPDAKPLQDKSSNKVYKSQKIFYEFDCTAEQNRILAISIHADEMGSGQVVSSDMDVSKPSAWEAISPGSNGMTWLNSVCKMRTPLAKIKSPVPISSNSFVTVRADRASVKREGSKVTGRLVYDYASPQSVTIPTNHLISSRYYDAVYDCDAGTFITLSSYGFSGKNAEGALLEYFPVYSSTPQAVEPESVVDFQFKYFCGLK